MSPGENGREPIRSVSRVDASANSFGTPGLGLEKMLQVLALVRTRSKGWV
jgi:hypothetical protein